ncbi:MAG TPA: nucleoside/nucleotide kinase family protein [Beijerinckiaceae bacterium]|nr:nucleoside/nucleotide kinase family protein [Beijerinckiaceae bacterium]
MHAPEAPVPPRWLASARAVLSGRRRAILGIAGPPGAGKSSLAAALVSALGTRAALVPMDGFHLANDELRRLGRAERKGAPDTFDAAGYVALLQRLRNPVPLETVYAPVFRREIEEAIAGAIPIGPDVALVVTEGNYLLLDDPPWDRVRPLLDACWYVDIDATTRRERLIQRHMRHGRSAEAARAWVLRSDEANASLIEATKDRADAMLRWPPEPSHSP